MFTEIKKTIDDYCRKKNEEKILKSEITKLNDNIKAYMSEHADEDISTDDFTVHIQLKKSESVDTDKMLEILKTDWTTRMGSMECPYIKRVEVVDMDALESAIYNGKIDNAVLLELDKCRVIHTTRALTYKVNKGGD